MIFYLIRHGISLSNISGFVTGRPSDPLIESGLEQAQALSDWLRKTNINPNQFITSNWLRAQQTARIVAPDVQWHIDPRLGETDGGEVAEWHTAKFISEYPDFYNDHNNCYPGGESHKQLNDRVTEWFDETVKTALPDDIIMIVAHSGPISCIIQNALGIGMEHFPAFLPGQATLSILELEHDGKRPRARLLAFSLGPLSVLPSGYFGRKDRPN